ncbi:DUF5606 domain-containing protein [Lutimonas saemankumensis]|uniref:DUF5606 family protein n=1 Tax=Lutimonas saemankumensis TaxID=483016 RepID=UPI001CD39251|nr:DUF5606 domain-containing protein [Lutimonas saemankumensis]MCA0932226.1 DUF5606 domain-containing protein [Lutimonas saemankumensis]
MTLEKVIAISGKPGLFEIISQSKSGVIVESLADKKRFPVNSLHNISTLNDIAIYTYEEEIPLKQVFCSIFDKEEGKETINPKSSKDDLLNYFSQVLPDFDQERVYASNIKKVLAWYNSLVAADFDFTGLKAELEEDNKEEES